jgi:hypothetical protein
VSSIESVDRDAIVREVHAVLKSHYGDVPVGALLIWLAGHPGEKLKDIPVLMTSNMSRKVRQYVLSYALELEDEDRDSTTNVSQVS